MCTLRVSLANFKYQLSNIFHTTKSSRCLIYVSFFTLFFSCHLIPSSIFRHIYSRREKWCNIFTRIIFLPFYLGSLQMGQIFFLAFSFQNRIQSFLHACMNLYSNPNPFSIVLLRKFFWECRTFREYLIKQIRNYINCLRQHSTQWLNVK